MGFYRVAQPSLLQSPAQAVYVDGQCIVIHEFVAVPKAQHQILPGYDPALAFQQKLKDAQLIFGQGNPLTVLAQTAAV